MTAAEFYATLLDAALSTEKPASGHQGYYFPENGEIDRVRISIVVARVLAEHGKVGSADPLFVAKEKVEGNFIVSRCLYSDLHFIDSPRLAWLGLMLARKEIERARSVGSRILRETRMVLSLVSKRKSNTG
jgi:hypothetical protein